MKSCGTAAARVTRATLVLLLVGCLLFLPKTEALASPFTASTPAAARLSGKIALMTSTGGDILLLNPATGKLQRLTDGLDPEFSPDGAELAFTRWGATPGVFVRDLKTGRERMVVGAQKPRHPTWSSDGQKLAFVHLLRTKICRSSPFGCLTDGELRGRFGGRDCLYLPGRTLCISDFPILHVDLTGIVEIGLDGTGWQDLGAPLDAQSVSWQPNSEDLLFRGNNHLQLTGVEQTPRDIVSDDGFNSPVWSPDGTKFVAQKRIHDHTDLALFDATGKLIKYLTAPPSALQRSPQNVSPAWSPDGKTILFLTDREAEGVWKLYRMNADGTSQSPFLPNALKTVTFRYDFAAERVISWSK